MSAAVTLEPQSHLLVIGGSDAGISASLRAREIDPSTDVPMVVADGYPNFSICGTPWPTRSPTEAST